MSFIVPNSSMEINTQAIACEEPRTSRIVMPFANNEVYTVDLQQLFENNTFKGVQAAYIDTSQINDEILITVEGTNQRIIVKEDMQGYTPLLITDPPRFTVQSAGNGQAFMHLLNVPVPVGFWSVV